MEDQLKKKNIHVSPKDLNLLVELYRMGGYEDKVEQSEFFDKCIKHQYKKTVQSVRNTLNNNTDIL